MSEFNFLPPDGSVYVEHTDPTESTTVNGIVVFHQKPEKFIWAPISASTVDGINVGDMVFFERARGYRVQKGILSVKEEYIEATKDGE